jgi:hypothetical protein
MHPLHAGLEKRSPPFWGQHHSDSSSATTKRSIPEYSHLVARQDAGSILEVRAFDNMGESALAKRTEGLTIVRLVRRSPKVKIAAGFKVCVSFFMERIPDKPSFHLNQPKQKFINKVGEKLKKGFGEVVKFGAKIYATAAKAVGRVANFIPGVGKAISSVANGVSRVANFVSDKIPVKLPAKLQKGVNIMNDIQDPFGK